MNTSYYIKKEQLHGYKMKTYPSFSRYKEGGPSDSKLTVLQCDEAVKILTASWAVSAESQHAESAEQGFFIFWSSDHMV